MTDLPEYKTERIFDAPREVVWRAWTDPTLLHRWYGPGVETVIHKFELQPGGMWLNEMRMGGKSDFSKMVFEEVNPPERLVWRQASSDSNWNEIANQMMPDWPRSVLTTVTFEDMGSKTKLHLTWKPVDASDAEIACFTAAVERFGKGWSAGFAIIDEILEELQA